jgi:UDP-4-amino-4,6-dideoxy-N-acetyl-beta-L-altrosamine transaminase
VPDGPHIPYGRQWIDDDDVAAVVEALRSDYLTTGPRVGEFERALAAAAGSAHAVVLNSGTSALHAMYVAAGLRRGQEIVTSPLTFAATANAALYVGASVKFVDVSPDTGTIDPAQVAAALGPSTHSVVAVDYAGHPADYDALAEATAGSGVSVLADAAHSLGATYRGCRVGGFAKASALSFHPVKAITTGEGGAVVTDDRELAERVRRFRTHGITRDQALMERDDGPWHNEQHELGFNYRLTDVQAALGISQLRRLESFVARRRAIVARYLEAFADLPPLTLPHVRPGVEPAWHLFVVRVPSPDRRRAFVERLHADGIGVQVHYIPVHHHPYYRALGFRTGVCPVAEDFSSRAVSLPVYPAMSEADVERVIETVARAARETL